LNKIFRSYEYFLGMQYFCLISSINAQIQTNKNSLHYYNLHYCKCNLLICAHTQIDNNLALMSCKNYILQKLDAEFDIWTLTVA